MKNFLLRFSLERFLSPPFLLLLKEISIRNARCFFSASVSAFPTPESVPERWWFDSKWRRQSTTRTIFLKSYWCSCQKELEEGKRLLKNMGCRVSTRWKRVPKKFFRALTGDAEIESVQPNLHLPKQQHNQNFGILGMMSILVWMLISYGEMRPGWEWLWQSSIRELTGIIPI